MHVPLYRSRMKLPLALVTIALSASAQSKLQLKVHTGAGVNGYDVNSTMISGGLAAAEKGTTYQTFLHLLQRHPFRLRV